jgi:cobalamin biosynthetic protein CobC
LNVAGGTILFRLAEVDDAADWFARLAAMGILTRPFGYAPTWLRFGVPRRAFPWFESYQGASASL